MVSLAYGNVQSFMGLTVVIKAFVAMVIGGLTSLPGAVARRNADRPGGGDRRHRRAERLDRDGRLRLLILTLLFLPKGLFGRGQR